MVRRGSSPLTKLVVFWVYLSTPSSKVLSNGRTSHDYPAAGKWVSGDDSRTQDDLTDDQVKSLKSRFCPVDHLFNGTPLKLPGDEDLWFFKDRAIFIYTFRIINPPMKARTSTSRPRDHTLPHSDSSAVPAQTHTPHVGPLISVDLHRITVSYLQATRYVYVPVSPTILS